jgi:hypothetical protein
MRTLGSALPFLLCLLSCSGEETVRVVVDCSAKSLQVRDLAVQVGVAGPTGLRSFEYVDELNLTSRNARSFSDFDLELPRGRTAPVLVRLQVSPNGDFLDWGATGEIRPGESTITLVPERGEERILPTIGIDQQALESIALYETGYVFGASLGTEVGIYKGSPRQQQRLESRPCTDDCSVNPSYVKVRTRSPLNDAMIASWVRGRQAFVQMLVPAKSGLPAISDTKALGFTNKEQSLSNLQALVFSEANAAVGVIFALQEDELYSGILQRSTDNKSFMFLTPVALKSGVRRVAQALLLAKETDSIVLAYESMGRNVVALYSNTRTSLSLLAEVELPDIGSIQSVTASADGQALLVAHVDSRSFLTVSAFSLPSLALLSQQRIAPYPRDAFGAAVAISPCMVAWSAPRENRAEAQLDLRYAWIRLDGSVANPERVQFMHVDTSGTFVAPSIACRAGLGSAAVSFVRTADSAAQLHARELIRGDL